MKRDIIIIEDKAVSVTGNEVWMTATEIAGLFHTTVPAVNAAIKAVRKSDVLNDYELCRYMQLENGLYADVYALEIIIPVAFRLNTYNTHLFPIRQVNGQHHKRCRPFTFSCNRLTPAACGSSLPAPRAAPFPGKAPSLPKG